MVENKENSSSKKIISRTALAGLIAGIGAVGYSLVNHESVQAVDSKNMDVSSLMVPGAEAMEIAGLVQVETEYPTPFPIYTSKERQTNFKDWEVVNTEEGKKTVVSFLSGVSRMISAENPEYRAEEIVGISLYVSDDTNKDGIIGFSPAFLVKDQQTGELKPYAFSQNSLDDNNKILNIIDLSAGGDGYDLECMEIDGQPTFTRKIGGVTEQYLDNAGEWQYYISEKMAKRFAEFEGMDCSNWEKPCTVATAKDLKDRTLLQWFKVNGPKFSDKVYKNGKVEYYNDSIRLATPDINDLFERFEMLGDIERKPIRMIAHFLIEKDYDEKLYDSIYLDVMQIYNPPDGSVSYLFFEYVAEFISEIERRRAINTKMAYTMPGVGLGWKPKVIGPPVKKGESMLIDSSYYEYEEKQELYKEWVETNKVPMELEGKLQEAVVKPKEVEYTDGRK